MPEYTMWDDFHIETSSSSWYFCWRPSACCSLNTIWLKWKKERRTTVFPKCVLITELRIAVLKLVIRVCGFWTGNLNSVARNRIMGFCLWFYSIIVHKLVARQSFICTFMLLREDWWNYLKIIINKPNIRVWQEYHDWKNEEFELFLQILMKD